MYAAAPDRAVFSSKLQESMTTLSLENVRMPPPPEPQVLLKNLQRGSLHIGGTRFTLTARCYLGGVDYGRWSRE
jgi:hypothetical protein